jgi:predicted transcriptional regulator
MFNRALYEWVMNISFRSYVVRSIVKSRSRSWIEIAAAILYSTSHGAITRTRIMSTTYLSYEQTVYYLTDLLVGELIEPIEDDQKRFRTTEKGHEFLKAYERLQEITPANRRANNMPQRGVYSDLGFEQKPMQAPFGHN